MKYFYLVLLLLTCNAAISQNNQWSWESGSDQLNQSPIYGTKDVAAPANFPGWRNGAASWTTPDGKLWLFGGNGPSSVNGALLNDLWVYDPSAKLWTWKNGPKASDPPSFNYGAKGVPNANNLPRGRANASAWTDKSGNLWLFGGDSRPSESYLNDLWKYEPATGLWTWVSGAPGAIWERNTYGAKGVPDPVSMPGGKGSAAATVDNDGNFWLVGGIVEYDISTLLTYTTRDVWKFDPVSSLWTWYSSFDYGNLGEPINYGTKGVPSASNTPPTRASAGLWFDGNGNLYWFGGLEIYLTGQGPSSGDFEFGSAYHNDLWRYNIQTGTWTWINGSDQRDAYGAYGTKGTPGAANTPGSRSNFATFAPVNGKFQIFGGVGKNANADGLLNDSWSYDPATNQWTWTSGSNQVNQPGNYGTKGIPNTTNIPGAREGAAAFTGSEANLWIYGGRGYNATTSGQLSDLWKLGEAEIGQDVFESFKAKAQHNYVQLNWKITKGQRTDYILVEHSRNGNNFEVLDKVRPSQHGSSRSYKYVHVLPGKGDHYYRLKHVDKKGIPAYSWIEKVYVSNPHHFDISFLLYPNPVINWVYMSFNAPSQGNMQVMVYNYSGQPLLKQQQKINAGFNYVKLNLNKYKPGVYTVVMVIDGKMYSKKLIKL